MLENLVTTDSIMEWFTKQVESKSPISPVLYLDAGLKLNILREDDDIKLIQLKQKLAKMRLELLQGGLSATAARMHVEAEDLYKELLTQMAKVDRIEEFIKLSKLYSRLKSDEYRNS